MNNVPNINSNGMYFIPNILEDFGIIQAINYSITKD